MHQGMSRGELAPPTYDPGSFRDRRGRVCRLGNAICRVLDETALANWRALAATSFQAQAIAAGSMIRTRELPNDERPDWSLGWAGMLEHDRVPFISYPYEWSFGMLRDAARLQLELLDAALDENFILKDASAYNIQWRGVTPVFIDVPAFERYQPGQPWSGYRQFCQLFLNPLLLQAYKNIPFQPWLRGCLDGIAPEDCRRFFSLYDCLRPGVLLDVLLHARLQPRGVSTSKLQTSLDKPGMGQELAAAGFHENMIRANARRLQRVVEGLRWQPARSTWSEYARDNSYGDADRQAKMSFVESVLQSRWWECIWDLGANTGTFARMAAAHADLVVALDRDALAVEKLYHALRGAGVTNVLPLVNDLSDSSPNQGWRGAERKALLERGSPQLVLALALMHHLVLGDNIPVEDFVDWLASFGADLVVEFVTRDDPMVQTLLREKRDVYSDYDVRYFEHCLSMTCAIVRREVLPGGTRILYHAQTAVARG